jgi:hypothetical protein
MKVRSKTSFFNPKSLIQFLKLNLKVLTLKLKLFIQYLKLNPLNTSLNPLLQYLIRNPLTIRSFPLLSTSFWLTHTVLQIINRRNTCRSCSATKDSLHTCCSEAQNTGGSSKTSTIGVITRGQPYPCSISKEETALEATPRLLGHLMIKLLVVVMAWCSTSLGNVISASNKQELRYFAVVIGDLCLVTMS